MKTLPLRFALIHLFAASVASAGSASAVDEVLAAGYGFTIRRAQFEEDQRVHADEITAMTEEGVVRSRIDWGTLQSLITQAVVLARATPADRIEAEKKFHADFQAHKARVKISDAAFEEGLASQLVDWKMTRARWAERGIDGYLAQIVTRREVGATISAEEIASYYQARLPNFELPERIRARFILLGTVDRDTGLRLSLGEMAAKRAQMEKILQRARAGEDFLALEKAYSEAAPSRDKSGEYVFQKGQSTPEFDAAVFALSPGAISDLISTDSGFQIVRVDEKIPARRLELGEVNERIREALILEKSAQYLAALKAAADLKILDPALRAQALKAQPEAGNPAPGPLSVSLPRNSSPNQR